MKEITTAVANLCREANYYLGEDVLEFLRVSQLKEESAIGREIFNQMAENCRIAAEQQMPLCQDTGLTVIFLEIGQDLHIVGGDLNQAVQEGVRQGYRNLRKSIVEHPLQRINTKDNTPAIIHTEIVPGQQLKIIVAPKGGGSENKSRVKMLQPVEGTQGVKQFVLQTVEAAGASSCPPLVVGVGIGGNLEQAPLLAKKALLRPLGQRNPDPQNAALEEELLQKINALGIGPQGLGGRITAWSVAVETWPCHIASLPVAVNLNCHVARHKEIIL